MLTGSEVRKGARVEVVTTYLPTHLLQGSQMIRDFLSICTELDDEMPGPAKV